MPAVTEALYANQVRPFVARGAAIFSRVHQSRSDFQLSRKFNHKNTALKATAVLQAACGAVQKMRMHIRERSHRFGKRKWIEVSN